MRVKLPVEIYKEAQAAEKSGDLEGAMKLYADSTHFYQAARIAQQLGRTSDAIQYFRDCGDNFSANKLAKQHSLPMIHAEGEIVNTSEDSLENLSESLYLSLSGQRGKYVCFNGLTGNVLDVGCRDGRFFGLFKKLGADNIYGADLDSEALQEARKKEGINPENIYGSKVEDLSSEFNGFFDYAVIFNLSLGDKESRSAAVEGISRTLKPNGRFLATFTTLEELKNYSPEIEQHFNVRSGELINGSGELDSAPHRYIMYGVRK